MSYVDGRTKDTHLKSRALVQCRRIIRGIAKEDLEGGGFPKLLRVAGRVLFDEMFQS